LALGPQEVASRPACLWCERAYTPHRGGAEQRFCGARCRAAFHRGARLWALAAVKVGLLEIADLKRAERSRGRGVAGARQAREPGVAEAYTVSESASA
jgi:hypothetical protein